MAPARACVGGPLWGGRPNLPRCHGRGSREKNPAPGKVRVPVVGWMRVVPVAGSAADGHAGDPWDPRLASSGRWMLWLSMLLRSLPRGSPAGSFPGRAARTGPRDLTTALYRSGIDRSSAYYSNTHDGMPTGTARALAMAADIHGRVDHGSAPAPPTATSTFCGHRPIRRGGPVANQRTPTKAIAVSSPQHLLRSPRARRRTTLNRLV